MFKNVSVILMSIVYNKINEGSIYDTIMTVDGAEKTKNTFLVETVGYCFRGLFCRKSDELYY